MSKLDKNLTQAEQIAEKLLKLVPDITPQDRSNFLEEYGVSHGTVVNYLQGKVANADLGIMMLNFFWEELITELRLFKNLRMVQLKFSDNRQGSLLNEVFDDVRLPNTQVFHLGQSVEIIVKGYGPVGRAEIVCTTLFRFDQIRNNMSFRYYGKPVHYMAGMLKKFYGELESEDMLQHIVFKWTHRYQEQQDMIERQWEVIKQNIFQPKSHIQL